MPGGLRTSRLKVHDTVGRTDLVTETWANSSPGGNHGGIAPPRSIPYAHCALGEVNS